jgi:hypothetical protein
MLLFASSQHINKFVLNPTLQRRRIQNLLPPTLYTSGRVRNKRAEKIEKLGAV